MLAVSIPALLFAASFSVLLRLHWGLAPKKSPVFREIISISICHDSDSSMRRGVGNYSEGVGTPLSCFLRQSSPFTERPRVQVPSGAESKNQLSAAGMGKSQSAALHPCSSLAPTSFDASLISSRASSAHSIS